MRNLKKLKKDLQRYANSDGLRGEGAEDLRELLEEASSVVSKYKSALAGEKLLADKTFLSNLYLYIREGNEDLQAMKELRQALVNEQTAQSRNQFKSAAIQLATAFKQGRELNVIAALVLVNIAASINDVSLLPKAKALARIGGSEK